MELEQEVRMSFLDNAGGIATKLGNVFIIVLVTVAICAAIIGVVYWIMKQKQYKRYQVHIYKRQKNKDGKEFMVFCGLDKAAIKKDKKLKRFALHLKKRNYYLGEEENTYFDENRNLDIPTIPSEEGGEIIFVEKLGKRKYALAEPFIIKGSVELMVTDADVADALRTFDLNAKFYGQEDFWGKYGNIISVSIIIVFCIIIFAIFMNKFEILTMNLKDVSEIIASKALSSNAVPTNIPG